MNTDVRAALAILPAWLQPLITWITGEALLGQRPLFRHTAGTQLTAGLAMLFGGALATALLINGGGVWWLIMPISLVITTAGARFLQANIYHQASHERFTGRTGIDIATGEMLAVLLLLPPYAKYRRAHAKHHNEDFASVSDPDFRFFRKFGLEPGLPVSRLRYRLWLGLIRPWPHLAYLRSRLEDNFVRAGMRRRLAALGFHGGMIALAVWMHQLPAYLLAWVLPVTLLYQMSAFLQFTTEHLWLLVPRQGETKLSHWRRMTVARFQGEAPPAEVAATARGFVRWTGWWFRLLTVHLFWRVFVVQGPLVVHDYHHDDPRRRDWPEALYARQRQIDSGRYGHYTAIWGFFDSITRTLETISSFPVESGPASLSREEQRALFRTM